MESLVAAQRKRRARERQGRWRDLQDGARRRPETELNLSEEFSMRKLGTIKLELLGLSECTQEFVRYPDQAYINSARRLRAGDMPAALELPLCLVHCVPNRNRIGGPCLLTD